MKPAAKLGGRHHPSYQIRLHQSRRKEIFTTRLPVSGIVDVLSKISATTFGDQRCKFFIARRLRVVKCKRQSKSSVGMHAGANWISLFRQKRKVLLNQNVNERLQISGPLLALSVIPL